MQRIVLDTSVIDYAFLEQNTPKLKRECRGLVNHIAESDNCRYAIDKRYDNSAGSKMESEYRNKLGGARDFEKFWIEQKDKRGKVDRIDISAMKDENEIDKGLDAHDFPTLEQSLDRVFVYTAYMSDRILATQDSDFGVDPSKSEYEGVYKYLTDELQMTGHMLP